MIETPADQESCLKPIGPMASLIGEMTTEQFWMVFIRQDPKWVKVFNDEIERRSKRR